MTLLRACRRSAKAWASLSPTAPAARLCQIERDRWSKRVSVRAPSIAAAIWSQKDRRSPSGGKARRRDVTHVRQSSAVARNDHFRLDERAGFREDQIAT